LRARGWKGWFQWAQVRIHRLHVLKRNVPDPLTLEPWGCGTVIKKFAGPDESDYNLHLSNSSYPKVSPRRGRFSLSVTFSERAFVRQVIDEARMMVATLIFPNFYRSGETSFNVDFDHRPSLMLTM